MTAKQALAEYIEGLTDEEAEELLARLDWESTEEEHLSPAEMEEMLAGEAEIARGEKVSLESLIRRLNL
jgi:PHD/YefM family antitoxin component YafN of YafNO toxin-antitoxin module